MTGIFVNLTNSVAAPSRILLVDFLAQDFYTHTRLYFIVVVIDVWAKKCWTKVWNKKKTEDSVKNRAMAIYISSVD